jgi:pseudouridine-5'-phosphate glycosidase
VSQRVDDATAAARTAAAHWQLGGCGLLLTNPPPESIEVEGLIEDAVAAAAREGISGQAVTPFVLAFLHERSGGRTREVNRALAASNARLAGEVSVAFAGL